MNKWIYLVIGGASGTVARFLVSGMMHKLLGHHFPHGTLAVNLIGCFVVGLLYVLSEKGAMLTPDASILLVVGFCGAFTTFSAWMLDTAKLVDAGHHIRAFVNIFGSVLLGFIVFQLGVMLGKNIV
jgi:fluoride exporter